MTVQRKTAILISLGIAFVLLWETGFYSVLGGKLLEYRDAMILTSWGFVFMLLCVSGLLSVRGYRWFTIFYCYLYVILMSEIVLVGILNDIDIPAPLSYFLTFVYISSHFLCILVFQSSTKSVLFYIFFVLLYTGGFAFWASLMATLDWFIRQHKAQISNTITKSNEVACITEKG